MSKPKSNAAAPTTLTVIMKPETRPGLVSCGEYLVGKPYAVPPETAHWLVSVKGFSFASDVDERAYNVWREATAAQAADAVAE